jgi:hypothetical protein
MRLSRTCSVTGRIMAPHSLIGFVPTTPLEATIEEIAQEISAGRREFETSA